MALAEELNIPLEPSLCSGGLRPSPTNSDLSVRSYWVLAILLTALYVGTWLFNFPYVYGWNADDWAAYVKRQDTIRDPCAAFTNRANLMQPYFFLYTYLPIASGISVPSHELPIYGGDVGNFRFVILLTIFFHGGVALSWAWFAPRISRRRWAALLSLPMFLVSTQFVLWTPQSDTRLIGFPLLLLGIWLLLTPLPSGGGARWMSAARLFAAGSLFGLAQSLHYTSLYLALPATAAFFLKGLWTDGRRAVFWTSWVAFAAGCLWLQGLLELLSACVFRIPCQFGPTQSLLTQAAKYPSPLSRWGNLCLWSSYFQDGLGWPMIAALLAGGWLYAGRRTSPLRCARADRLTVVAMVLLGLIYVMFSRSVPVFRKTSVLQPFLFLMAAELVAEIATRVSRRPLLRWVTAVALLTVLSAVPVRESLAVYQGHLGLGKVLAWADANKGDRQLRWLVTRRPYLYPPQDLLRDDPENWLITYYPLEPLMNHPTLAYFLNQVPPLKAQPTLWATATAHTHHYILSGSDLRQTPVLTEARVYRIGDLQDAMRCHEELAIETIRADSQESAAFEAGNVLDGDDSPDGCKSWRSAATPGPHWLEITLKQPRALDTLSVVLSPWRAPRPRSLEVQQRDEQGAYRTLWTGEQLQYASTITAHWASCKLRQLRLVFRGQVAGDFPSSVVQVEEVLFPGYKIVGSGPQRPFAEVRLHSIRREGHELVARGENITEPIQLVVGGKPLATNRQWFPHRAAGDIIMNGHYPPQEMHALLPPEWDDHDGGAPVEVYLADRFRRSNALRIDVATLRSPSGRVAQAHATLEGAQ